MKTVFEDYVSSEIVAIPAFCLSMIMMEVAMYLPSTNKIASTNQQANKSYSISSFNRSI